MILRKLAWSSCTLCFLILLPMANFEEKGPTYDTNDWIPIQPKNNPVATNREEKSLDRVLNVGSTPEKKNVNDGKFVIRKPTFAEHRPRKNVHIKRSPNQRPRIKLEQPYRFESVLSPPPKKQHQVKTFPQKVQYQQGFSFQPQYQFIPAKQGQVFGQQVYQPIPPNQQIFTLNGPQNNPQYSTLPLEIEFQQSGSVPKISSANKTIFLSPRPSVINSELFDIVQKGNVGREVKSPSSIPTREKESVQLLYVPLEQLQKQPNLNGGILDEAFKSLQQQKLVAKPDQTTLQQQVPESLPLVNHNQQQVFLDQPKYSDQVVLQDSPPPKADQEQAQRFELISKSRGQLILQDNPKIVNVPVREHVEVYSEKQELVEVSSRKPDSDAQEQPSYIQQERHKPQIQQIRGQFLPREPQLQHSYIVKPNRQKPQEHQFQLPLSQQTETQFLPRDNQVKQPYIVQQEHQEAPEPQSYKLIQQTRNQFIPREPQIQPSYVIQQERRKPQEPQIQQPVIQQTRNQFVPQLQQTYLVQQEPQNPSTVQSSRPQYVIQNAPQNNNEQKYVLGNLRDSAQKSRLEGIQRDILQQSLEVEKLQKQIQQGKSLEYKDKNNSQAPKKKKPHQPPLAVFMEGNNQGDIDSVLEVLKSAKSISVRDEIGPNSPQIFIGPSNLNTPEGFAKFPLPYLSNLDNNRIQRKAQQLPFFVAPLNYKEPEGYSKIPLPSPHVGSVVVNRFHFRPQGNQLDTAEDLNRQVPITNYKYVNPDFSPTSEGNSNFDTNLNQYSLESSGPRENPNKQLKEQTLFQQITGFSGFPEFPQNQYFQDFNAQSELSVPEQTPEPIPARPPSRQKERGETVKSSKKGSNLVKNSGSLEESSRLRELPKRIQPETRFPETSPEVVLKPESVEVSSQSPLTQDFLNRFGPNNQNFNYASSTPDYGISSQSSIEEIPSNVRKLNVRPSHSTLDYRNQQTENDANFDQSITDLQNSRGIPAQVQNAENEQIIRDFEQYSNPVRSQNSRPNIPVQLTNINPNLPGLINQLQDQGEGLLTTLRYETNAVISTRPPPTTTQVIIQSTEAPTTTTTRRSRGRGKSRFNMRTTTVSSYRRTSGERRRPHKITTTESHPEESYRVNSYESSESVRLRPRTRVQNTISERVSEAAPESTPPTQEYQPITRVSEIAQNQPNYFMDFQSTIENERPVISQAVEEPQTEAPVRSVEQYHTQRVIPAEELPYHREEQIPIRQFAIPQTEKPETSKSEDTHRTTETEKPTRKRVRLRGRPKNKYSSSTRAPHTTTQASSNEQTTEFYGFIRNPNFSQSSQISSHSDEEQRVHIYAPIEQKSSPVYVPVNQESVITSSPRIDTETTFRFVGELRPKYTSPSRGTTTPPPEGSSTHRTRVRGRVRVPGRNYESKSTSHDSHTTEKTSRLRSRGRSHFTPPRNTRDEEPSETENYPVPYLRNKESSTTQSNSEFKITVDAGDEEDTDQFPYSTMNRADNLRDTADSISASTSAYTHSTTPSNEEIRNYIVRDSEESPSEQMQIMSFRNENINHEGFRDMNIDQFDTAESQNYRTLLNSIEAGPMKVNELKSKEIQEPATMAPMSLFEKEFLGMFESRASERTSTVDTKNISQETTTVDGVKHSTESVVISSETSTLSSATTTTEQAEVGSDILSTISSDSLEGGEVTSTLVPEEELKKSTSTEPSKSFVQTAMDLFSLQTSTSTEISSETEICFKGRCVKSRKKIRRPVS